MRCGSWLRRLLLTGAGEGFCAGSQPPGWEPGPWKLQLPNPLNAGSRSFQDGIPKLELGNEQKKSGGYPAEITQFSFLIFLTSTGEARPFDDTLS
jgi:hypothetical protein